MQAGLLLCTGMLAGCAWFSDPPSIEAPAQTSAVVNNENGQPLYVVNADYTPFYRLGPQQANGADQSLPKGTLVSLLSKNFGYSRVQLINGPNGYVATDDLAVAPPEALPLAVPSTASKPGGPTSTSGNSAIVEHYTVDNADAAAGTSTSNAEALPDLPEPSLDPEPTPVIAPDFRY